MQHIPTRSSYKRRLRELAVALLPVQLYPQHKHGLSHVYLSTRVQNTWADTQQFTQTSWQLFMVIVVSTPSGRQEKVGSHSLRCLNRSQNTLFTSDKASLYTWVKRHRKPLKGKNVGTHHPMAWILSAVFILSACWSAQLIIKWLYYRALKFSSGPLA